MPPFSYMKIFVIFFLLIASSVNAGVYKWTDKEGNVHFGDRPVDQDNATELNLNIESRAGITNSAGNNKERDRMANELEEDRKAREEKRKKNRAAKKKKQERCARLKDQRRRYQRANSIYKLNAKGDRVYYSKKERAVREKKLNKSIAKACR